MESRTNSIGKITGRESKKQIPCLSLILMNGLYQDFSYVPGKTNISTTESQAWAGRAGVFKTTLIFFWHYAGFADIQADM